MSAAVLEMCLVLVRTGFGQNEHVLLGEKRRGFGRGRIVAPGGKIDAGESAPQAAARELREETGLDIAPEDLTYCALLDFTFTDDLPTPMRAHVFTVELHDAEPSDSDEIAVRWVPINAIPYEKMWDDASRWLPRVLSGQAPHLAFRYGPDGTTVEHFDDLGPVPTPH